MKKILVFCLALITFFSFSTTALAQASSLNNNEKELYKFIHNGIEINNRNYSTLSKYENEFLNYLLRDYVDLDKSQCESAIASITEIYKCIAENNLSSSSIIKNDVISLNSLSFKTKVEIIKNGVEFASSCGLALKYQRGNNSIVITDKQGYNILSNEPVVKVTGTNINASYLYLLLPMGAICTVIIFRKKIFA